LLKKELINVYIQLVSSVSRLQRRIAMAGLLFSEEHDNLSPPGADTRARLPADAPQWLAQNDKMVGDRYDFVTIHSVQDVLDHAVFGYERMKNDLVFNTNKIVLQRILRAHNFDRHHRTGGTGRARAKYADPPSPSTFCRRANFSSKQLDVG
jgi:hypothetical protein